MIFFKVVNLIFLLGLNLTFIYSNHENLNQKAGKFAYISLLCDKDMVEPAKVLGYSLNEVKSKYPLIIMAIENIKDEDLNPLNELPNIHVVKVPMLKYPFKITRKKRLDNKACRYSKINAWRFIEFDKLALIDLDTIVIKNIDDVFNYDCPAAVEDIGGVFNTGLLIINPNMKDYSKIIDKYLTTHSYNHGDQGFLNVYFKGKFNPIPREYNFFSRLANQSKDYNLKDIKMIHYTGEIKPWSFYHRPYDYKLNFNNRLFYKWSMKAIELKKKSKASIFNKLPNNIVHNLNLGQKLCNGFCKRPEAKILDGLTLLIYNFTPSKEYFSFIKNVSALPIIKDIFLKTQIYNENLKIFLDDLKVKVFLHDNFNGSQYLPLPEIRTNAVCTYDGSKKVNEFDNFNIQHLYNVWKVNTDAVSGIYGLSYYNNIKEVNFLDSHMSIFSSDYLFTYTCLLPPEMQKIIMEAPHDISPIFFNLVISNLTGSPPFLSSFFKENYIHPIYLPSNSKKAYNSNTNVKHYNIKQINNEIIEIINHIIVQFFPANYDGNIQLPGSNSVSCPFTKIPYIKVL